MGNEGYRGSTFDQVVLAVAPFEWNSWLTALADMWEVNFVVYELSDEVFGLTARNIQTNFPKSKNSNVFRIVKYNEQWHSVATPTTTESTMMTMIIEGVKFELMPSMIVSEGATLPNFFETNKGLLAMFGACYFLDFLEGKNNCNYKSTWPVEVDNVNLFTYRSLPLGMGPQSGINVLVLKPLAEAGVNEEASLLTRVSESCTMVESSPSMIVKITAFIRTNRPWKQSDIHIIFGGGRRASILLELCTRSNVTIISIEKELMAHTEANMILSRYEESTGHKPTICNIHANTNTVTAESIRGATSASRFCGSVRSNCPGGLGALDRLIFESPSIEVYWCCHIDQKSFNSLLKNYGMNKSKTQTWRLVTISGLRQEKGRIQTYVWMRTTEVPPSRQNVQSKELLQWCKVENDPKLNQTLFYESDEVGEPRKSARVQSLNTSPLPKLSDDLPRKRAKSTPKLALNKPSLETPPAK